MDLEIERIGNELRIRPARRSLSGVLTKFALFSPDFMDEGRGNQEQAERDAL
jgi:antitoxin VapB